MKNIIRMLAIIFYFIGVSVSSIGAGDNQWNGNYYQNNSDPQFELAIKELAEVDFPHVSKCIELGCGSGRITAYIAQELGKNAQVIGIDYSESMIKAAQKEYSILSNLTFIQHDGRSLEQLEGSYKEADIVFSNSAIHWMDDHAAVYKGCVSCLKKEDY